LLIKLYSIISNVIVNILLSQDEFQVNRVIDFIVLLVFNTDQSILEIHNGTLKAHWIWRHTRLALLLLLSKLFFFLLGFWLFLLIALILIL